MSVIILDTNVVSEPLQLRPDPRVAAWARAVADRRLCTTAITLGELAYGLAKLPSGHRRDGLRTAIDAAIATLGPDGVLPYDRAAAALVGDILVARERMGRPIQRADAQIAAICRHAGAALATRNTADFDGLGLDLINPWLWSSPGGS